MNKLNVNLKKVYPSSDSTIFAAFEQGKSDLFITDLRQATSKVLVINFKQSTINSIRWVPGK